MLKNLLKYLKNTSISLAINSCIILALILLTI